MVQPGVSIKRGKGPSVQGAFKKPRKRSSRRQETRFLRKQRLEPPYVGCYAFLDSPCLPSGAGDKV